MSYFEAVNTLSRMFIKLDKDAKIPRKFDIIVVRGVAVRPGRHVFRIAVLDDPATEWRWAHDQVTVDFTQWDAWLPLRERET